MLYGKPDGLIAWGIDGHNLASMYIDQLDAVLATKFNLLWERNFNQVV